VNLLMTSVLLAVLATVLLGPVSTSLSRAEWVQRAPRSAVFLWQCVGLGALLSGLGAGLAAAASRYRSGFLGGTRELAESIVGGHPLQGLGLYDALGLTLAADLSIVFFVVFGMITVRSIRLRARHRRLLDLVAYQSPDYPGTDFLSDKRAVAYCLPGVRPRIVLSDGTRELLDPQELWAVIHHERGHAHERHGLVMLPMLGLEKLFGWVPYAKHAPTSLSLLLEMAADDFSTRHSGRRSLSAALVQMATEGWAPGCGMALTGSDVVKRVSRLVGEKSNSKGCAAVAAGLGIGTLLLPLTLAGLA